MNINKRSFTPTYSRENGLFVINLDTVKDLPFNIKERSLVNIPPKQFGGNHQHPRWEAFVGLGKGLRLVWQDETSQKHEEPMNPNGELYLLIIPPNTPHAVINKSESNSEILLEFASEPQHDVEIVTLV